MSNLAFVDASLLVTDQRWIARTLDRFVNRYCGPNGLLVTEIDGLRGEIANATPVIPDFGDVLPFLFRGGLDTFATRQVDLARAYLRGGLYRDARGRVLLFNNHDWLLGLLDLHAACGAPQLLALAVEGARTILEEHLDGGVLIDEVVSSSPVVSLRQLACVLAKRSSPFNVGYVELLLELHERTNDERLLSAAREIVSAYTSRPPFSTDAIFGRIFSMRSPHLDMLWGRVARQYSLLFKDNTNAVWGLLALFNLERTPSVASAIERWIEAFEAFYWNDGDVFLSLTRDKVGRDVSLKAAFSSLDLLCDLYISGFRGRTLDLAAGIADRWLARQWRNGLFPETPDANRSHLDCNTDMTVSLMKLASLTGEHRYAVAAQTCAAATITLHEHEFGFVLAVDQNANIVDHRVIVKYQSLLFKLAMMPADPNLLFSNNELLHALRDR